MNKPLAHICLITMGCPKNEVDSLDMRCLLEASGYAFVDEIDDANLVIVNTCAFLQEAVEENLDIIFDISESDKYKNGELSIVVTGCMPSRYGDDLERELDEVSAFVPCSNEDSIVSLVESVLLQHALPRLDCHEACSFEIAETGRGLSYSKPLEEGPVSSYIKIADGCNRFCSFCAIPYIRGRFHSFSFDEIVKDVQRAASFGAREMVLIAQDTGIWGSDFDQPQTLAWLVGSLADMFPDLWFRVLYLEPEGVTEEYLQVVANRKNVCSYFDIPVQHSNPRILRAMNRHGSADEFLSLIARIRNTVPEAVIRTTLIAGFPGESDEDFEGLYAFVEEAEFDYLGVFPYSREEGTKAYDLPEQVPEQLKVERAQKIRDLADSISTSRIAQREGQVCQVLIEGAEEDGQLYGRAQFQAPEIDGYIYVDSGEIGDIVSVRLIDSLFYELEGKVE